MSEAATGSRKVFRDEINRTDQSKGASGALEKASGVGQCNVPLAKHNRSEADERRANRNDILRTEPVQ